MPTFAEELDKLLADLPAAKAAQVRKAVLDWINQPRAGPALLIILLAIGLGILLAWAIVELYLKGRANGWW